MTCFPKTCGCATVGPNNVEATFNRTECPVNTIENIRQCPKEGLNAEGKNLTFLEDSAATKEAIINAISSLPDEANRNDLLFWIRWQVCNAGRWRRRDYLCGVAVWGWWYFRSVAPLFDCSVKIFKWNNHISFALSGTTRTTTKDMLNGGAFTQAILKVLKDKEEFILVVLQSFPGHVESKMYEWTLPDAPHDWQRCPSPLHQNQWTAYLVQYES